MIKHVAMALLLTMMLTACSAKPELSESPSDNGESRLPESTAEIPSQPESHASEPPSESNIQHPEPSASSELPPSATENPQTSGEPSTAEGLESSQYVDIHEACYAFHMHLEQVLNEDQEGGIWMQSDYNGSGASIHGGADKADPYILVWAVDREAVNQAVSSYTGLKTEIVILDAKYSTNQLNAIIAELQDSEIAPYIYNVVLDYDNKVMIRVLENLEAVESFLQSYPQKDSVSYTTRPPRLT